MKRIDFEKEPVFFDSGYAKWYSDKFFQRYLKNEQAENLPVLEGYGCFIVKGKDRDIEDYVLIDKNQNVIAGYTYNLGGFDQMMCRINIMKINKHFDEYEKSNV